MKNRWMNTSSRFAITLSLVLAMAGCQQRSIIQEDVSVQELAKSNEESYQMIVPFEQSDTRDYHALYMRSAYDFQNIGNRLMELSKTYFSPIEYALGEGTIITNERLLGLVKSVSATYEQGLNPERGTMFPSGKEGIEIENAIMISDVVEQNFFTKVDGEYKLAGLSLALVMNPVHAVVSGSSSYQVEIDEEILYDYGIDMGRKLERYLRTLGEVKNLPILITVYVKSTNASYLPGKMIAKAFFKDRSPTFERVNEQWLLLPSEAVNMMDSENASQFTILKQNLTNFVSENVGVVGYGFYENNQLKKLSIDIEINAKTYMELMGLVRYTSQLLQNFYNADFDLEVEIKLLGTTKALILKNKGANQIQPIILQ